MTNRTDGLAEEVAYWDRELALRGVHADYMRRRLDPARRGEEYPARISGIVATLIEATGRRPLRAIDLGSGPLTTLAWGQDRGQLEVDALDPLADEYRSLLKRHAVAYPVIPRPGHGEILANVVGSGVADLIYSRNALDHAEDVQRCFDQVATALKVGGVFVLEVFAHEGRRESYSGLHQYDFRCEDGRLRCSHRSGSDALDVASTGLSPVCVSPPRTLRVPEAGDPPEGIFAVFVKGTSTQAVAFRARLRNQQLLGYWDTVLQPGGYLRKSWIGRWESAQVRHVFPTWIEPLVLAQPWAQAGGPLAVLDLMSGPVPSLLWAHLQGLARVTAADSVAHGLLALQRRLGLEPPPVDWVETEPDALARALPGRRFHLVSTRHSLDKVEDLQAVFEAVSSVLEPGGLFVFEAVSGQGEQAAWDFPVQYSLGTREGRVEARDALGRSALDLARTGLEPVHVRPATTGGAGEPLEVCLRRRG